MGPTATVGPRVSTGTNGVDWAKGVDSDNVVNEKENGKVKDSLDEANTGNMEHNNQLDQSGVFNELEVPDRIQGCGISLPKDNSGSDEK